MNGGAGFDFSSVDLGDILNDLFGGAFGGFGGGSDFFSGFGGGRGGRTRARRGSDKLMRMDLSFDEAVYGCKKEINLDFYDECPKCDGKGGKGEKDVLLVMEVVL